MRRRVTHNSEVHARAPASRPGPVSSQPQNTESSADMNQELRVDAVMLGARQHYAVPKFRHQAGVPGRFYLAAWGPRWGWRTSAPWCT